MKKIVVLGSTGSIGVNALDVARRHPDKFKIVGLAANTNHKLLAEQSRAFKVKAVALHDDKYYSDIKRQVARGVKIYAGRGGVSNVATLPCADIVLGAIGGTASIMPLFEAIKAGKDIALASKEMLVSAGALANKAAKAANVNIIPVDSEHSAIFQCLRGENRSHLKRIYLTGSGGPLRTVKKTLFDRLPISRIISHPKWNMGKKITVDSATFMNKGLEVIEAKWLFSVDTKKITILVHPEAVIHSMVEFIDGTVMANMFSPDMRIPIAYAFSHPERIDSRLPQLNFFSLKKMTFEKPSYSKFPALRIAYTASKSESACVVLNAANEEAVWLFLERKIKFTKIVDTVEKVLRLHREIKTPSIRDIMGLDAWAKEEAKRLC